MTDVKRAVVIDDEPDLTMYIQSILEEHGLSVRTANDAKSGEDLIREDPPDLICLDLMMPGRSGTHLFTRLKGDEATSSIPIIMITGIKEKLNIDWAEVSGQFKTRRPEGVIEKPIDPVRLMRLVEEVFERETGTAPIG